MNDDTTDYGPLRALIGHWRGDKGQDIAPEPDGPETSAYHESLQFEACGDVTNAESQTLAALRYHQLVTRQRDGKVFHNETGYWLWDAERELVMQTLTIPRGVSLVAGGTVTSGSDGSYTLNVAASDGDPQWGIVQAPFMQDNARTQSFQHWITVNGDQLSYGETMLIDIYGKRFEHSDSNRLSRCQPA